VHMAEADSFKQFRFRVLWDGQVIPGISKVTGLRRTTVVVSHHEGSDSSAVAKSPGETAYESIVLERERTSDASFEAWADEVLNQPAGPGRAGFRKDIWIELFDEASQPVLRYQVRRCWPSEYAPVGELIATSNGLAIECLTLQHEGWKRET
jgi:phage tail-like protein